MTSSEVVKAVTKLQALSTSTEKTNGYNELLNSIISSSTPDKLVANISAFLESLLSDAVSIVTSRPVLGSFADKFKTIPDPDVKIEIGQRAIELLAPKVVSYEESDTAIKISLADTYEAQEDYIDSAKVLQTISLESSQRSVSDDDKATIWTRIMRCYLEDDDPTNATRYLNRIKNVIHGVQDKTLKLQFQLSQARILDSQRSFLEASSAYYGISTQSLIDEEERLQALSFAMRCAVLAPAGPQRGRTLARLYKDDRANSVEEFGILEKIFLDRLLTPEEVAAFAAKLATHQLAKTADGSTVLDKAVLEHNLLGVSRLYQNIGFDQLGERLGVDGDKAEQYAAQMIEQGRLAGHIDQIDRYIYFEGQASGEKKTGQTEGLVGKELRKWDSNVQALAEEVERVATMIQQQHPEFYAAHIKT